MSFVDKMSSDYAGFPVVPLVHVRLRTLSTGKHDLIAVSPRDQSPLPESLAEVVKVAAVMADVAIHLHDDDQSSGTPLVALLYDVMSALHQSVQLHALNVSSVSDALDLLDVGVRSVALAESADITAVDDIPSERRAALSSALFPVVSVAALCFAFTDLLVGFAHSDRADGLFATVVTDDDGRALGLVYSNRDSLLTAMQTRRGVYWSRSRNKLWVKGAESGAVQTLKRIQLDCDGDAIRFIVAQSSPGFCHRGRHNCWDAAAGHVKLQETLAQRRDAPMPKSYTNRLFNDRGLLHNKMIEEMKELIAAKTDRERVEELADVMYFVSVYATANRIEWADVNRALQLRDGRVRRRTGNAKANNVTANDDANTKPMTHALDDGTIVVLSNT